MRDYPKIIVIDYTLKNNRDYVELGTPNPKFNPRVNSSQPLDIEIADPKEVLSINAVLIAILGF